MEKLPSGAFGKEMEELKECRKTLGKFKSGSYIIMSSARMSGSSNPLEILLDYIRMVFHVDLIKFNQMLAEVQKNKAFFDLK